MNVDSNSRRSFFKKSLAIGIAAAQPIFLAGLVKADGGGDDTTLTATKTVTTEHTTEPETEP